MLLYTEKVGREKLGILFVFSLIKYLTKLLLYLAVIVLFNNWTMVYSIV